MTLRRKMAYQAAATVAGLLLLGGASLWGLNGLHQDYGFALEGYRALRELFAVGARCATAKALLDLDQPDAVGALRELEVAGGRSALLEGGGGGGGGGALDPSSLGAVRDGVARARAELQGWQRDRRLTSPPPSSSVDRVLAQIGTLAARIRAEAEARQRAAEARRRATIAVTAAVGAAVVAGAVGLGAWQYRGVVRPLQRLGEGVRRVAAGQFAERINTRDRSAGLGPDEFVRLAGDFNRMAAELDGFYRQLEEKVAAKSKELVRSERLASVGYLAAGVAHEINNPLGVIAGYAEYSLDQLRAKPGAPVADLENSLRIICDEAFRCRDITARLLSLARPGDTERRPVSLGAVAAEVASTVGGLRQFADRKVAVHADASHDLRVSAVEAELKQVVMNLLLNALEAVAPGTGEVGVNVGRDGRSVVLSVRDNGRGMTPEILERAFEPFFTDRRGTQPDRPGTGLGLSITHAIVEGYAGRVTAHSDGPGRGSTFTVRLPALDAGGLA